MKYRVKIGRAAVRSGVVVGRSGDVLEVDPEDQSAVRWIETQAHVVDLIEEPKPRKRKAKAPRYEDRSMQTPRDGGTSER